MTFKELYEISPVLNQIDVANLDINKDRIAIDSFMRDHLNEMGMLEYSYNITDPLVDHVLNAIAYCCVNNVFNQATEQDPDYNVAWTLKWFLNDSKLSNRYNENLDDITDSVERFKYFTRSSIGNKFIHRVVNPTGVDSDLQQIAQFYFNSESIPSDISTKNIEFVTQMLILQNDIKRGIISPYYQYISDDGCTNRASDPRVAHDGCLSLNDANENYRKYAAIQAYYFLTERPFIELMYRVLVDPNA